MTPLEKKQVYQDYQVDLIEEVLRFISAAINKPVPEGISSRMHIATVVGTCAGIAELLVDEYRHLGNPELLMVVHGIADKTRERMRAERA